MISLNNDEINKLKSEINFEQPSNKQIVEEANYYFHKLDRNSFESCLLFINCLKIMKLSSDDKIKEEIKKFNFLKELNRNMQKYYNAILGKKDALYFINEIYMMNTDLIEDFIIFTQNTLHLYTITTSNEESDFDKEELELLKS